MPAETLLPSAIVDITGALIGSIADLTDDPASPDGLWVAYDPALIDFTNPLPGAGQRLRVSFPTPTNDLTPGAGLQTFRLWLRRNPLAGNDPSYKVEIWEAGAFVQTVIATTTALDSAGFLVSGTWDASLLADITGADVECYIELWRSLGGTGTRRVTEVGAIAWDVVYDEPVVPVGPPSTPCIDDARILGWSLVVEGTETGTLAYRTEHATAAALPLLGLVAASVEGESASIEVHERQPPRDPVGRRARLSCEVQGQAAVVIDGVITSAQVGEQGEATQLAIGYADGTPSLWSPSQAIVEGSHPGPLPMNPSRYRPVGSEGARYPIVYGYPGEIQVRGVAGAARPVVPLYLSEISNTASASFAGPLLDGRFLLDAQSIVWGQLSRSSVYWSDTTVPGDVLELVENAAGDPYWRVRGESGFSTEYPVLVPIGEDYEADQLGVGYSSSAGRGGGVRENGVCVSTIAGAASHLLRTAGLPFDARRSARAAAAWAGMRLDAWVDTDADPRAVVRGWVEMVGGSLVRGPDGYWLRYTPAAVAESDVRWRLTDGVDCERVSKLAPSTSQPLGSLVVEYGPAFGEYLERITLTPDLSGRPFSHAHAGLSRAANAEERTVQVSWTFDLATALAVADYIIESSRPRVTAAYAVPGGNPLQWRIGDGVAVDGRRGVVVGVDIASIGLVATVSLEGR